MQKIPILILALALASIAGSASAQVYRTADDMYANPAPGSGCGTSTGCIFSAATVGGGVNPVWGDNESTIILDGPIMVKEGGDLQIRPGTIVRGQPRYAPVNQGSVAGSPGVVVVTQSGEIHAEGNCDASGVIIFTTAAVDNNQDGIADDLNGDGFLDQYPGFAAPCTDVAPQGPDNILGTTGAEPYAADDNMVTCAYGPGIFYDANPSTAPLAPLDPNGNSNLEMWGGVVILGHAPTNLAGTRISTGVIGQGVVEGFVPLGYNEVDLTYGGVQPHDSSGVVECVSVRHGGDEVSDANELNGFTLGAQGDGTVFSYAEVYANQDDGFEWFGGTINTDHLVVTFAGDDSLDVDQGYTGVNQFSLSISPHFNQHDGSHFGSRSGDKAGEWDGDDCDETGADCYLVGMESLSPLDLHNPGTACIVDPALTPASMTLPSGIFYNYTVMGNSIADMGGADFDPDAQCLGAGNPWACCTGAGAGSCTASVNEGIEMRNGFGGELRNSIVVNTGAEECIDITTGGAPCWTAEDNVCANHDLFTNPEGDLLRVVASTFSDCTMPSTTTGYCQGPQFELDALANGDALTGSTFLTGNKLPTFGAFAGLVNEDTTFDPQGTGGVLVPALKSAPIDPRSASSPGFVQGISPGGHPVADPVVTYRGAFDVVGPLWTDGWTVLGISGLLQ